jgi:aldose 1-epimerase
VTDKALLPTGEIAPVEGTPFDFRVPHPIGDRIAQIPRSPAGYDDNFALNGGGGPLSLCARLIDPTSGRGLEVRSTEPGLQVYSGGFLDGSLIGKGGVAYPRYGGICLETQHFPRRCAPPPLPEHAPPSGRGVLEQHGVFFTIAA